MTSSTAKSIDHTMDISIKPTQEEWESYKIEIVEKYVKQPENGNEKQLTLKEMCMYLNEKYSKFINENHLEYRIRKWGLNIKNNKKDDYIQIHDLKNSQEDKRNDFKVTNKCTGIEVSKRNLKRAESRYDLKRGSSIQIISPAKRLKIAKTTSVMDKYQICGVLENPNLWNAIKLALLDMPSRVFMAEFRSTVKFGPDLLPSFEAFSDASNIETITFTTIGHLKSSCSPDSSNKHVTTRKHGGLAKTPNIINFHDFIYEIISLAANNKLDLKQVQRILVYVQDNKLELFLDCIFMINDEVSKAFGENLLKAAISMDNDYFITLWFLKTVDPPLNYQFELEDISHMSVAILKSLLQIPNIRHRAREHLIEYLGSIGDNSHAVFVYDWYEKIFVLLTACGSVDEICDVLLSQLSLEIRGNKVSQCCIALLIKVMEGNNKERLRLILNKILAVCSPCLLLHAIVNSIGVDLGDLIDLVLEFDGSSDCIAPSNYIPRTNTYLSRDSKCRSCSCKIRYPSLHDDINDSFLKQYMELEQYVEQSRNIILNALHNPFVHHRIVESLLAQVEKRFGDDNQLFALYEARFHYTFRNFFIRKAASTEPTISHGTKYHIKEMQKHLEYIRWIDAFHLSLLHRDIKITNIFLSWFSRRLDLHRDMITNISFSRFHRLPKLDLSKLRETFVIAALSPNAFEVLSRLIEILNLEISDLFDIEKVVNAIALNKNNTDQYITYLFKHTAHKITAYALANVAIFCPSKLKYLTQDDNEDRTYILSNVALENMFNHLCRCWEDKKIVMDGSINVESINMILKIIGPQTINPGWWAKLYFWFEESLGFVEHTHELRYYQALSSLNNKFQNELWLNVLSTILKMILAELDASKADVHLKRRILEIIYRIAFNQLSTHGSVALARNCNQFVEDLKIETFLNLCSIPEADCIIYELAKSGIDVLKQDRTASTALTIATECNNFRVLEFLLSNGASQMIDNLHPLDNGYKTHPAHLRISGVDKAPLLWLASYRGHIESVLILLKWSADINIPVEINSSVYRFFYPSFKDVRMRMNISSLEIAATFGRLDIVHILLRGKPNVLSRLNAEIAARNRGRITIADKILQALPSIWPYERVRSYEHYRDKIDSLYFRGYYSELDRNDSDEEDQSDTYDSDEETFDMHDFLSNEV